MKTYELYTLDNKFIKETNIFPDNFTGMIKYVGGSKAWFLNGKLHNANNHAVEYQGGAKRWCINGKSHRLDGPAYESPSGLKQWYIDDQEIIGATPESFKLLVDIMRLKGLL